MLITIIICSYDRRESLARTLDTLALQSRSDAFAVLVIDNNSADGTSEMVESRIEDFPVELRVEVEPTQGLSHARNLGLEIAEGDVVVFIDDDVDCPPDFVSAWTNCFEDPTVAAAGGRILPRLPEGTPDWLRERLAGRNGGPTSRYDFGDTPSDIRTEGPHALPFGANMAMRRELARKAGGFRTDLGWGSSGARLVSGEETELFTRIQREGHRIAYCPSANVVHRIPASRLTSEYLERWYHGYGRASILRRRPRGWKRIGILTSAVLDLMQSALTLRRTGSPSKRLTALEQRAKAGGRIAEIFRR